MPRSTRLKPTQHPYRRPSVISSASPPQRCAPISRGTATTARTSPGGSMPAAASRRRSTPRTSRSRLFDWDNTISKNDFGDAITYWFIANAKVLQPPGQDWHATSAYLTDAAATALIDRVRHDRRRRPAAADRHEHRVRRRDAQHLRQRGHARRRAGVQRRQPRRMEPAFAWTPQLMAGYTHAQVQAFTTDRRSPPMLAAPRSTRRRRSARTPGERLAAHLRRSRRT